VDGNDNVYVADSGNDRVQEFTSNGTFVTKWYNEPSEARIDAHGALDVAVDRRGYIYVGNQYRVEKFAGCP